jgi:hypothetical protein
MRSRARALERRANAAEAFNKQMADVYLKASGELQAKLRASEARVKELEEERKDISSCRDAACAKLQRHYDTLRKLAVATWRTNYADEAPQWEPLPDIDGIIGQIDNMTAGLAQQVAELKWDNAKILATRRLRPIAEAGPVPEGAVRVYGRFFQELGEWVFSASVSLNTATHCVDVWPPARQKKPKPGLDGGAGRA